MIYEQIYEHFFGLRNTEVHRLSSPAVIFDQESTISDAITLLIQNKTYDAFSIHNGKTFLINHRMLLDGKDILHMKIKSLSSSVPAVHANDTIEDAAKVMNDYRIRAVPIISEEKIIGQITSNDILKEISKRDIRWISSNWAFTSNPIVTERDCTLSHARKLMIKNKIDHIPILKNKKVLQVLTSSHIIQCMIPNEGIGRQSIVDKITRALEQKIGNIGTNRVFHASPETPLNHIIDRMLHTNTTFALISDKDRLCGIITHRDIIDLLNMNLDSKIPISIVGLQKKSNDGILIYKIKKTLSLAEKMFGKIHRASYVIKLQNKSGRRQLFTVIARIFFSKKEFRFQQEEWDLSIAIESLNKKIINNIQTKVPRSKESLRKSTLRIDPMSDTHT